MVEGGGVVHTQFLADDLVDELHCRGAVLRRGLGAPRFVADGHFPWNAGRRATLAESAGSATWYCCATRCPLIESS